jgi:hypothetical protein
MIMADNKVTKTAKNLTHSIRETSQTIADKALADQERTLHFAQDLFLNGIEVLKSQAEDTSNLVHTLMEQPQKQQENIQAIAQTALATQERSVKFAQNAYSNGVEVLNHQVESTRSLAQELVGQSKHQVEQVQSLAQESWNVYMQLWFSPIAYYKRTMDEYAEAVSK